VAAILGIAALAALGAMALRDGDGDGSAATTNTRIRLAGVDSYDPEGDNQEEHDEQVAEATDGDPETSWTTEDYDSFQKSGVGLVLDAGRAVEPATITVTTDTPGYTAEIRAGDSLTGPFDRRVSGSQTVADQTTFRLTDAGARYFVIWITALEEIAHVNEVRAR
jgi:hypothetical protein